MAGQGPHPARVKTLSVYPREKARFAVPSLYSRDSLPLSVLVSAPHTPAQQRGPRLPLLASRPLRPTSAAADDDGRPTAPPSSMASSPSPVSPPSAPSTQRKRGSSTDSIGMYAVQCCECHKWRKVPTKDEFETIRENFTEEPWHCSRRPDCSCEDPADIEYDSSRIWVLDKPNIPKPPAGTERLVIMRGDLSKMDTYYVMPNGKRVRCTAEVDKFLEANPQYKDRFSVESFSFTTPKIVEETVSHNSVWKSGKAKKQDKINALSNNN
ncbi:hypothetical protein OsJ_18498 [Oryza sativa Japonica Group]|uniref:Uncharacterized protein n=1 Tax=Oryza sativa subsp. japonica TaxID=39947 RepID=B9FPJ2_ORYSJ|nr:hypothetical protein OsJ_18498 [Oryza sativa Japonica Group]